MPLSLLHSPADIVRRLLISLNQGTDPSERQAWPVFATNEPDAPDNCITIYDTVGLDSGRIMISGELINHHGFQVRVRSTTSQIGYPKIEAIKSSLLLITSFYQEVVDIDTNSYLIHSISHMGQILPLGKEVPSSRRNLFTLNALVNLRRLS